MIKETYILSLFLEAHWTHYRNGLGTRNLYYIYKKRVWKDLRSVSKGLKFCPTPNSVDKSVLKEDLEKFGRTFRLKWHYRNDKRTFHPDPFRPKSKFNPSKTDASIELYLTHIEEKLLCLTEIKHSYYNLTREERQAMCSLKNDQSMV